MQWWVTVGAMAMAAASWLSPGPTGALTVYIQDHPVQPLAIAVRGPVERDVLLDGAQAATVAELPEGSYQVRPVFAGSVSGAPVTVAVGRGRHTQIEMPLGRIGGVRFDADPGMCEPEHPWSFVFGGPAVGANHPDARSVAGRFMPEAKTCQREVGGLAAGRYWVRVTPNGKDWPPSSTLISVEAGRWTTVRIDAPAVIVRGRITSRGEPVAGVQVQFVSTPDSRANWPAWATSLPGPALPVTDNDGRYVVGLPVPGTWRQTVRTGGRGTSSLPQGDALEGIDDEVTFGYGINFNDLELGGGDLRVWFSERGSAMAPGRKVTLTMQSLPSRPREVVVTTTDGPHEQRIVTPGRYVISATAQSQDATGRPITLVSARQQEVEIAPFRPAYVLVELVERDAIHLEVRYADGSPSAGAYVVAHPGAPSLRTDEEGRVSLDTVAVGTQLSIRTRMWGITCHTVTSDLHQRVVVEAASAELLLAFAGDTSLAEARRMLGGSTLSGIPGAGCAVPFEGFSAADLRQPDGVIIKLMVPPGTYSLTLRDGRTLVIAAPGRVDVR